MTYELGQNDFSSLMFLEFEPGWSNVGMDSLDDEEREILQGFINALPAPIEQEKTNLDEVLLVKADENGTLLNVYGPTIYQHPKEESLILKLGSNEYAILETQTDGKRPQPLYVCGQLEAVGVERGDEVELNITTDEGKRTVNFNPLSLFFEAEDSESYQISCQVNAETEPTMGTLKTQFNEGGSLAYFLRKPSAGDGAMSMKDLQPGEYNFTAVERVDGEWQGKPVVKFIVTLDDGRKIRAIGGAKNQFSNKKIWTIIEKRLKKEEPCCIRMAGLEKGQYVRSAVYTREAKALEFTPAA